MQGHSPVTIPSTTAASKITGRVRTDDMFSCRYYKDLFLSDRDVITRTGS
jgi:hypothetical protein